MCATLLTGYALSLNRLSGFNGFNAGDDVEKKKEKEEEL